ncbi:MAG: Co2+/Mg2+ efflux protein ApaG [Bacteroidota bacterium]
MTTLITKGIKVSIETFYQPDYSKPVENKYVFAYRVTIENLTADTVQLLRRKWEIIDASAIVRVVEGEGVIGQQPIIPPGEVHQYVSWCNLQTSIGKMHGTYTMKNVLNDREIQVAIPVFNLVAPFSLN